MILHLGLVQSQINNKKRTWLLIDKTETQIPHDLQACTLFLVQHWHNLNDLDQNIVLTFKRTVTFSDKFLIFFMLYSIFI